MTKMNDNFKEIISQKLLDGIELTLQEKIELIKNTNDFVNVASCDYSFRTEGREGFVEICEPVFKIENRFFCLTYEKTANADLSYVKFRFYNPVYEVEPFQLSQTVYLPL